MQGSTCEGKDPQTSGCSADAVTIGSVTYGERVDLRWSAVCDAVWARTTSDEHYNTLFMQVRSYEYQTYARKKVYGHQVLQGTYWTKMLRYSGQWNKACVAWGGATADPTACTGYL